MLRRPIVIAALAAILAMQVPAQPIAAMMATTPSQLREATAADKLELAAWHHHHWHRHYWHWYFPRFWLWGWPWHHHRHHPHQAPPATETAPSKPAEPETTAPSQPSPQAPNQ